MLCIRHAGLVPEGLIYAVIAGLVAREVLGREKPNVAVAVLAGVLGTVVGSWLVHRIGGSHQFHAFRPESLIAGLGTAIVLLFAYRTAKDRLYPDQRRIFF